MLNDLDLCFIDEQKWIWSHMIFIEAAAAKIKFKCKNYINNGKCKTS